MKPCSQSRFGCFPRRRLSQLKSIVMIVSKRSLAFSDVKEFLKRQLSDEGLVAC